MTRSTKVLGLLYLGAALMFLLFGAMVHCTTTTLHTNSFGAVIEDTDLNTAIVGSIVSGEIIEDQDGREGTSIRIHPKEMYAMFDEGIVFCGDEKEHVAQADGSLLVGNYAFIYRRAAPRLINGIPCFELRAVYKIVEPKEK